MARGAPRTAIHRPSGHRRNASSSARRSFIIGVRRAEPGRELPMTAEGIRTAGRASRPSRRGGVRGRRQALIQSCEASIRFADLQRARQRRLPADWRPTTSPHHVTAGILTTEIGHAASTCTCCFWRCRHQRRVWEWTNGAVVQRPPQQLKSNQFTVFQKRQTRKQKYRIVTTYSR